MTSNEETYITRYRSYFLMKKACSTRPLGLVKKDDKTHQKNPGGNINTTGMSPGNLLVCVLLGTAHILRRILSMT